MISSIYYFMTGYQTFKWNKASARTIVSPFYLIYGDLIGSEDVNEHLTGGDEIAAATERKITYMS